MEALFASYPSFNRSNAKAIIQTWFREFKNYSVRQFQSGVKNYSSLNLEYFPTLPKLLDACGPAGALVPRMQVVPNPTWHYEGWQLPSGYSCGCKSCHPENYCSCGRPYSRIMGTKECVRCKA